MQDQLESIEALQRRVATLEENLAKSNLQPTSNRTRRRLVNLACGLVPMAALAGWALAQQEVAPAPGVAPPPAPATGVIRKVGAITQVTAPFEVVDGAGKVILSVSTADDSETGVSIYVEEGSGVVSVHSDTGETVTELGADEDGNGLLNVMNSRGTPRAGISGEGVAAVLDETGEKTIASLAGNEHGAGTVSLWTKSGKPGLEAAAGVQSDGGTIRVMNANGQTAAGIGIDVQGRGLVAVVDTGGTARLSISQSGAPEVAVLDRSDQKLAVVDALNGKGRVAVLGQGRAAAELTFAEAGGGSLAVYGSGGDQIATVGTGANGRGSLTIFHNGIDAAVLSTGDSGAGGLSLQNAQGQDGLVASGAEGAFGGSVLVYNNAGQSVAGIGAGEDGKGRISIVENDTQVAVLKANAKGAGGLILTNSGGIAGIEVMGEDEDSPGASITAFDNDGEGAVSIEVSDADGGVISVHQAEALAELSAARLALFDGTEPVLSLDSDPGQLQVFNSEGAVVRLGLSSQETGEVVVAAKNEALAGLGVTSGGGGRVAVFSQGNGKVVAGMQSRGDAGLIAVANSIGDVVSEMSVFNDQGQVAVWNPGGKVAAAIMTRSLDNDGGLVQVANASVSVASLTVGSRGTGYFQLNDASGQPTIEAGTMPNGNGRVQAGPMFKCSPGGAVMALAILDCIVGTH